MTKLLLFVWDRLSLYLPIVLMGLLALGTYWLVQSAPEPGKAEVKEPLRHDPDYFMKNFSVRTFMETGRLKSEVFGLAARHYPDSDTTEIDKVRIRSFDDQGRLTTATANRALSNSDASEVELFGNAIVVREPVIEKGVLVVPRMEFRGQYLHAFLNTDRVQSDKPVELRRGSDVFLADSLDYDNKQQIMVLRGRVKGTLIPQPAR